MKRLTATVAWLVVLISPALCADTIVGTWRIESFIREVTATGQRHNEFGDKPSGYISYLPDGRMHAMLVADNRARPTPTDKEKAELFGTMIAYAGTYRIEGDKVVHDVEVSWNPLWTGSKQVRFLRPKVIP